MIKLISHWPMSNNTFAPLADSLEPFAVKALNRKDRKDAKNHQPPTTDD
jgi:hypothetical protein